ncbi:ABC transporter ATP-binding protein [Cellulomonas citrea]|uniref:ABC transporter ATP-binding protein n=1 Tax=Cellulomonas citrea TaxID=1909423 RepID=UPI00135CCE69|nr:ABC transporter ATP-binding protein [Cellulomonas citrea]
MSGLELRGLQVSYRRRGLPELRAVDGVDLDVAPGEVVGLVGESGCGKSTLARAVCGLERPTAGSITFDGDAVEPLGLRRRPARLARIQMVFQNPNASLNPRRRVGNQIEDARAIHPAGHEHAPSIAALLADVGLDAGVAGRYPHEFSGGQRQRLAIARAMAAGPRLLIGDEPIASLDASLQAQVARLLRDVAVGSGAGLLFISHDLSIVRTIADRVAVMRAGRIVEEGPTEQVWTAPQDAYTRRLIAAIPVADGLGRLPEVDLG